VDISFIKDLSDEEFTELREAVEKEDAARNPEKEQEKEVPKPFGNSAGNISDRLNVIKDLTGN